MARVTYDKEITALLVIDPYNDFISEWGKVWDRRKGVREANHCVPHMLQVLNAAMPEGGANDAPHPHAGLQPVGKGWPARMS
jgi:ureidoacrylate peracid hydrolase